MTTESVFLKRIQSSKIRHPTQRGFTRDKWIKEFCLLESPTENDRRIYEAGLWFDERLTRVRKKYEEFPDPQVDTDELIQIYVAIINREYKVISDGFNEYIRANAPATVWAGQFADQRLPIGPHKESIHLIGAMESMVTAVRHLLSDSIQASDGNSKRQPVPDIEVLNTTRVRLNLAGLYDELCHLWTECLWNGWKVSCGEDQDLLMPCLSSDYLSQVLGEFRRDSLLSENTQRMLWLWKDLSSEEKQRDISRKRIVEIRRIKKKKRLILGTLSETDVPPRSLIGQIWAEELYWNEILLEPLPNLENITIRDLLLIWDILASLGYLLKDKLPKDTGVFKINKLLLFAPTLQKTELRSCLIKATGLSPQKVSAALKIFTFLNDTRYDTWFKPLVPLGQKNCTFIIPALTVPNLIRSIEHWMREGGLNLSERGEGFEKFMRLKLFSAIKKSAYLNKTHLSLTPIELKRIDGEEEEIDLIWVVGSSIFIGEIKCSIYPTSPIERHNFFEVLHSAANQAKRKAAFVESCIDEVFLKVGVNNKKKDPIKVYPIVITNLPFGPGVPIEGVPITDLYILQNYIKGQQKFVVLGNKDGEGPAGEVRVYYSSEEEAESNLPTYLMQPPLFTILSKLVSKETIPLPPLTNDTKNKGILRFSVKPPEIAGES